METLIIVSIFLFGVIIGSFLNVILFRYHSGAWKRGRSMCFSCTKQLSWFENIPVLSYVALRGKCRHCKSKISHQYIFVEFTTALLFVGLYLLGLDLVSTFIAAIGLSLLVLIFVYDINHKIIPDGLVALFILSSLFYMLYNGLVIDISPYTVWDYLAGPIFFVPFFLLWYFSKGEWMGLGDGKLAVGIGWFLGFYEGLSALMYAFWLGAVVSVGILLFQKLFMGKRLFGKRFSMKSEIPFAPFLIAGFLLVFFFEITIADLIL